MSVWYVSVVYAHDYHSVDIGIRLREAVQRFFAVVAQDILVTESLQVLGQMTEVDPV